MHVLVDTCKAHDIKEIGEQKYELPFLFGWLKLVFLGQICISQTPDAWPPGGSKILPTDSSWDAAAPWGHGHDLIFVESWCGDLQGDHWAWPTYPQNRLKSRNMQKCPEIGMLIIHHLPGEGC